ncbi:hypothetical protein [Methylocystis parvus]|uniref:hypothetical protein n=1 Tax=Methylocystis parvus TaxID=134 RepID=UPI003C75DBE5
MANAQVTAIVTAEDHASAVLKAIAKLAQQVSKELDNSGKSDLARQFAAAELAARGNVSTLSRMKSVIKEITASVATLAAGWAAVKIPEVTKAALEAGAHLQHEEIALRVAGIPALELEAAKRQIHDLQLSLPIISTEKGLEVFKELRSVLKDVHEVPHMLPALLRAKAALDAADPTGGSSHGLGFLVKGAEVAGIAQNPERFAAFMDASVRAMQVMGRTINPEQIFEVLKYEKSSASQLSDRFQVTTALSLSQELGGSTTGQAVDQFVRQIIGGFQGNLHAAAKEFVSLGLASADDFLKTKTGEIKGMLPGRKVTGADLAQTDPDKWVLQYLVPALKAHGFADEQAQIAEIRRLFPAGRAADLVSKIVTQHESFENHAKLYEAAEGLKAVDSYSKDAAASLASLQTSLKDIGAVATEPLMAPVAGKLQEWAAKINGLKLNLADWIASHPKEAPIAAATIPALGIGGTALATWGGWKGLKALLGGAALDSSAVALTGSAAALTEAAALLGGKGVAAGAAAAGGRVIQGAGAASGAMASAAAGAGASAGAGVTAGSVAAVGGAIIGTAAVAAAIPYAVDALDKKGLLPHVDGEHFFNPHESARKVLERMRFKTESPSFSNVFEHYRRPAFAESSLPQNLKWFGKDAAPAGPQHVDVGVQGTVTGEATLMNRIVVEPSPLLTAIVKEAQQAKVTLQGALGRSMPSNSGVVPRATPHAPLGMGSGGFGFGVAGTK